MGARTLLLHETFAAGKKKNNPPEFRFINTHLEAFNAYIRNAQA